MSEGIGRLTDGDAALISNAVERIRVARQFEQKALVLTEFEMDVVWKAGLIALSSEAGRDSVKQLQAQVDDLAGTLRQITRFKPVRNQMTVIVAEMQKQAQAALARNGLAEEE